MSGSPIIQDACAAIRNPKFDSNSASCSGDGWGSNGKTCCWREQVPGQIVADIYCQTCKNYKDANGNTYEKCSDPVKQAIRLPTHESGPLGQGGVLEQQPTDKNLTSNQFKDRVDLGQLQELQEQATKIITTLQSRIKKILNNNFSSLCKQLIFNDWYY